MGLKGWLKWALVDRSGREVRGGEQSNLITDAGLDMVATTEFVLNTDTTVGLVTWFPIVRYAAVGTDNTAPEESDTALGAQEARIDTSYQTETLARPSPGVYQLTRYFEFDYDVGNGNLVEWAVSPNSGTGPVFCRELFRDGGGTPEVVSKTEDYKLRLIYTLEIALAPTTFTPGSFVVTGVEDGDPPRTGDYLLLGSDTPPSTPSITSADWQCGAPDLRLVTALARGGRSTVTGAGARPLIASLRVDGADRSGAVYANTLSTDGDSSSMTVARQILVSADAYTPGSCERAGGVYRWDTPYGNLDPIRAFFLGGGSASWSSGVNQCARAGYVFDLDEGVEFAKDNEHRLSIGAPTVTWGRA